MPWPRAPPIPILKALVSVFITIIVVGFIAITALGLKFEGLSVYAIPYCIIPLLIRTFFGNRLALFIFVISIFIISFIVPSPFEFILLEIVNFWQTDKL